jgi:hypothetical protein
MQFYYDFVDPAHVWLDYFFQGVRGQIDVGAVSAHGTVLEISTIHKDVHKVVVELHPMCMGRSSRMVFLHISGKFAEMPPVFKNTHVSRNDIGDHMKAYAEERGIMNQKKKCLILLVRWSPLSS